MRVSAGASKLLELPYDCLQRVLVSLAPVDLVTAVPRTCRGLRAAAGDDSLWRLLREARYEGVLQRVFDGRCPSPQPPQTWRVFYFEFGAAWPSLALQEVGKVIVTLHGSTFDLTGFRDEHPGGPALLLAAAGASAAATSLCTSSKACCSLRAHAASRFATSASCFAAASACAAR